MEDPSLREDSRDAQFLGKRRLHEKLHTVEIRQNEHAFSALFASRRQLRFVRSAVGNVVSDREFAAVAVKRAEQNAGLPL